MENYAIFHHDPSHDDDFMDNAELDAKTFANHLLLKLGRKLNLMIPVGKIWKI